MYRMCSRNNPFPIWGSGHADIVRASQLQHAVEGADRYVNFYKPRKCWAAPISRRIPCTTLTWRAEYRRHTLINLIITR
jgi:hypothetical protein